MSNYEEEMGIKFPERVKYRIFKRWKDEITKPRLKGRLSFEESLQMLINRCMTCEPEEFPENVNRLYWSLPQSWRDNELYNAVEECQEEFEYSSPVINCGIPVRSDILPELKERVTEMDWHMLFNAILNCANRRNLLIPKERVEVVTERE